MNWRVYIIIGVVLLAVAVFIFNPFGAPRGNAEPERFVVSVGESHADAIQALKSQGFVKYAFIYNLVSGARIKPGGYKMSKSMTVFQVAKVLKEEPYMEWVTVPEGLRKEEVADLLAKNLDWSSERKKEFLSAPSFLKWGISEGVFFPETYLMPKDESGSQIAARMFSKFNEKLGPYTAEFTKQNIKWTTGVKLASIIQREAAGKSDMALISGILWNRLEQDIPLGVDATIQYAQGVPGDWWPRLKTGYQSIDSPYNTYKNKGLPPGAISNPGMNAILAALNPQKTDCLFYLHDNDRQIHCAKTYAEHQANIEKYLK
jgi:UPF0755 protein